MPRAGTATRRRAREGLAPVKPGKISWVHGTKLPFFQAHREAYLEAAELRETGEFYEKLAHLYLAKYGYNTDWAGDLEDGLIVAADVDPDEDVDTLLPEESARRAEYFKKLKGKIGVWFNSQYGGSVEKPQAKVTFKALFDKPELDPPKAAKPRILHYYSRRFYHQRVQAKARAEWEKVSAQENPPKEITAAVMEQLEKEHKAAVEAYTVATSGDAPKTPAEYNTALNNAGYYLQPFVDAIFERFGMNVSLLLCGPIPDHGGRIEMRSVHAGMTNGLVPRIWSDVDRAGFDAAQRSLVQFSHQCFTEAECQERSLDTAGSDSAAAAVGMPVSSSLSPTDTSQAPSSSPPGTTQVSRPATTAALAASAVPQPAATAGPDLSMVDSETGRGDDDGDLRGDLSGVVPSTWWSSMGQRKDPRIGRALGAELARLPDNERETEMEALREMSEKDIEDANEMAQNRLFFARVARGIDATLADAMSSDPEESDPEEPQPMAHPVLPRVPRLKPRPLRWTTPHLLRWTTLLPPPMDDAPPPPMDDLLPPPMDDTPPPPMDDTPPPPMDDAPPPPMDDAPPPPMDDVPPPPMDDAPPPPMNQPPPPMDDAPPPPMDDAPPPPMNDQPPPPIDPPPVQPPPTGAWPVPMAGEKWPDELANAVAGFARGQAWGGVKWETCVSRLLELERLHGFVEKGQLKAPAGKNERPEEVAEFMNLRQRWGNPFPLKSDIGPRDLEGTFAQRWWTWWKAGQPEARVAADEWQEAREMEESAWDEMRKRHGRNGILLYLGGLLWWGEAAAVEGAGSELLKDWGLAVDNVCAVLGEVVGNGEHQRDDEIGDKEAAPPAAAKASARTTRSKRKETQDADKENDVPKRRRRSA
ncbi:hypothetical protein B0H14DRAFT_3497393 [Mycena olivaceomarginata]|nr:hypothetical protein B0H14DRAFT_3497393 [Mycena olivaceomarginata]